MTKIIYQTIEGGVAVVTPTPGKTAESLVSKVVPSGALYEIVDDSVLPASRRFRNAWEWHAIGSPIVLDIIKVKESAQASLRNTVLNYIEKTEEKEALGEAVTNTMAAIITAYQNCINELNDYATVNQIEHCMDTFTSTYAI